MLRLAIFILIGLALLSYLGFDLRGFVESDLVKNNFGFVWDFGREVWENYLAGPAKYLWQDVFVNLIWGSFILNFERLKSGESTTLHDSLAVPKR